MEQRDLVLESAEIIDSSARRINAIIQDLLDSARLGSGQLELKRRPLDLAELS